MKFSQWLDLVGLVLMLVASITSLLASDWWWAAFFTVAGTIWAWSFIRDLRKTSL